MIDKVYYWGVPVLIAAVGVVTLALGVWGITSIDPSGFLACLGIASCVVVALAGLASLIVVCWVVLREDVL